MKRNLIYAAVVIVLGLCVYFFVIRKNNGTYSKSESDFSIKDTASVMQIVLTDLSGHKIDLARNNDSWQLNGKYKARPETVRYLLQTLYQLEVVTPVAKSMYNNVVKEIAGSNVKVEIFGKDGKKIKGFYIGQPSQSYRGNFMLMEKSDVPFVVNIPGFNGFVSSRFTVEELEWRDRSVFAYDPEKIQKIEVQYPTMNDSSFTITRDNGKLSLSLAKGSADGFNPEIASYYLKQFTVLTCESFIQDMTKKDSVLATTPVCIIAVTDPAGTNTLKVFYRPVTFRSKMQFNYKGEELNFDPDKFYGVIENDKDLVVIQSFVFGKLFVTPPYFFRQRPVNENVLVNQLPMN